MGQCNAWINESVVDELQFLITASKLIAMGKIVANCYHFAVYTELHALSSSIIMPFSSIYQTEVDLKGALIIITAVE